MPNFKILQLKDEFLEASEGGTSKSSIHTYIYIHVYIYIYVYVYIPNHINHVLIEPFFRMRSTMRCFKFERWAPLAMLVIPPTVGSTNKHEDLSYKNADKLQKYVLLMNTDIWSIQNIIYIYMYAYTHYIDLFIVPICTHLETGERTCSLHGPWKSWGSKSRCASSCPKLRWKKT